MIEIRKSDEFDEWHSSLREKEQMQIDARLHRIEEFGHFGDVKYLGKGLAELRWKNGWRVYFFKASIQEIVLLIGGNKNAQEKDIERSRMLLRRYAHFDS